MRARFGCAALIAISAGLLAAGSVVMTLEARQSAAVSPVGSSHPRSPSSSLSPHVALIGEYCLSCHDETEKKAGLALDMVAADVSRAA